MCSAHEHGVPEDIVGSILLAAACLVGGQQRLVIVWVVDHGMFVPYNTPPVRSRSKVVLDHLKVNNSGIAFHNIIT